MNKNNTLSYNKCYRPYDEDLMILRLAPNHNCITVEWADFSQKNEIEDIQYSIWFRNVYDKNDRKEYKLDVRKNTETFFGFIEGVDYSTYLVKTVSDGEMKYSLTRMFRTGEVPGTVINYIHPFDRTYVSSGCYPTDPSILRLPSGRLLIVHDVYGRSTEYHLSKLFYSDDDGASWAFLTDLSPCKWGTLFMHKGNLYIIGTNGGKYPDMIIAKGNETGEKWTPPTVLIEGDPQHEEGVHQETVPVVLHKGRLWTSVEWNYQGEISGFMNGVASVSEDADLLDASQWEFSEFVKFDPSLPGIKKGEKKRRKFIEGNVVITPDDKLVNILRYNGGLPESGIAAMFGVNDEFPNAPLTFERIINFPGSHSKFTIRYDSKRARYISLVNRATLEERANEQRNILSLVQSKDLVHWEVVEDVFNYEENDWYEDYTKAAFQYIDWILEGDRILAVSRTALHGARDKHDNNYITFHTIDLD